MPPAEHPGTITDAKRLFGHVLKRRGLFLRAALMLVASSALQLSFPKGAEFLVDGTLRVGDPRFHDINIVCMGLLGIVILILIARYFEICWFQELGERAIADVRGEAFDRLMRLPMGWHAHRRAGDLSSRLLADLAQVQELWIFDLRMFLTYAAIMLGGAVMLVVTAWQLASVALVVAPLVAILALVVGPKIRRQSSLTQQKLARGAVIAEESLQGIQNVKTCVTEAHESSRFRQSLAEYLIPALRGGRARALFVCCIVLILLCTWVYMMWHGSVMIREGRLTPGKFTSFMFYLAFSGSAAGVVAENYAKLQRALGAHSRILEILDAKEEPLGNAAADAAGSAHQRLRGEVAFENVRFHYPTRPEIAALDGITFQVHPGENIALAGSSGAGKSTVASLLCRLYDPQEGRILIDGRPATDYPLGWLRSGMAFVPQEVLLFGGTVAENIAYGRPDATEAEVREAAGKANALEFIERLPEGFATTVGDRGAQLSGGQRQRIALARAILKDPAILILDEATSALDAESEALIQAALEEIMRGRTTFIIAHRLSTVRRAHRILVLQEGRLMESGSHEELLARKGAYWHLCEQQLK